MSILKPIKSNVIVELIEKEKVTSGGIILQKADPTEANRGLVVAIGPEVTDIVLGQEVLPNWNAAKKMKFEEQNLYVVNEEEIVLIFED
jgi:co-chaperonin GroES (HSP10)